MSNGTKSGRFVKGLVVGALVGTAVGLLVAPQTGRQTRDLLRDKTGGYVSNFRGILRRSNAINGSADHAESQTKVSA